MLINHFYSTLFLLDIALFQRYHAMKRMYCIRLKNQSDIRFAIHDAKHPVFFSKPGRDHPAERCPCFSCTI